MPPLPRPLEFRAFHIPTSELFPVDSFNEFHIWPIMPEGVTEHGYSRRECVLMQFTGIYDDAGTKVWERDIIRGDYVAKPGLPGPSCSNYYRVEFVHGCFGLFSVDEMDIENCDYTPFSEDPIGGIVVGCCYTDLEFLKLTYECELGTTKPLHK